MMVNEAMVVKKLSGKTVTVRGNDIDTDRIIPARFMKVVTFDGLGEFAFQDERFDQEGNKKKHPFKEEAYAGAEILIVNKNFGCGSSREHAPQALNRWGIKAVVGESYAEIFAGNCGSMGIPAVTASAEDIEKLMKISESNPEASITIDLQNMEITAGDLKIKTGMQPAARSTFLEGSWDSTASLLVNMELIEKRASELPYIAGY